MKKFKELKLMVEEKKDKYDEGEYDQEGDMAKSDLRSIMANAKELHDMIDDADNLPEWCQNKITLAEDYISTVANYLTAEMSEEVKTVTVKHKTSGKELVVSPEKAKQLKQQDYHPVKEEVSKADVPAYLRKQKGEKPLTMSDVKAPRKDSISAKENLAKARNEEVEQIDEEDAYEKDRYAVKNGKAVKDNPTHQGSPNYKDQPHHVYATSAENALKNHTKKEEVELDEVKMADLPSTKVQGRAYGASKPEPHPLDVMKGPTERQLLGVQAEKKKKKFSEMVNLYQDGGMKSFMEALSKEEEDEIIDEVSKEIADYTMDVIDAGEYTEVTIGEEASQDEFNAEIEKAKAKSQGRDKAEVAKAAVQAVQQEEVDMNSAEMKKREKIVKGMKKGMEGFKERYGARAKNVMYATATKRAMEK